MDDLALLAGRPDRLTRRELDGDALGLRARVPHGADVVVRARHAPLVAAALCALEGWARRVNLVADNAEPTRPEAVTFSDQDLPSSPGPVRPRPARPPSATAWRLRTSGTTGTARHVEHPLALLSAAVRPSAAGAPGRSGAGRRWGLLYPPTRMAGLQVLLQALGSGETVCDATHLDSLARRVAWLGEHGVDALSATPTLWRQVLQSQAGPGLRLQQITLGGEIAPQPLLDALRRTYPEARITHVYATTETGSVFAVSDGRAGFPAALLDAPTGETDAETAEDVTEGVTHQPGRTARRLQVRDDVLRVWAPDSGSADPDGFVTTGDLVRVEGDRVHFRGRAGGVVNVGGEKVLPEQTEAVLLTHERVADVRVTARPNAFAGAVLVADVVLEGPGEIDVRQFTDELRALVTRRLSRAHAPARVAVVTELPVTSAGKAARR